MRGREWEGAWVAERRGVGESIGSQAEVGWEGSRVGSRGEGSCLADLV